MEASEERRVKVEDTVFQASGFYECGIDASKRAGSSLAFTGCLLCISSWVKQALQMYSITFNP